jgi:transglutaminase-like putative cysteine protease
MPRLHIRHRTTYSYRKPVSFGEHRLMVRPRESYDQHVLSFQLKITPGAALLRHVHDVFGNCVSIARFERPSDVLCFESLVDLEHRPHELLGEAVEVISLGDASASFDYDVEDAPDLMLSIRREFDDPERALDQWVRRFLRWNGPTQALPLLSEMTRSIHSEFTYKRRLENGVQSPAETLACKTGTCRDFAVLMMEAARTLGLAAHFVSGYIYVPAAAGTSGARVGGGHTHAWVEVYLPSCGWVEFDPTNGLIGNNDLVRVAAVRHPRQATPLWGSWAGSASDYVGMDVDISLTMEPERALDVA